MSAIMLKNKGVALAEYAILLGAVSVVGLSSVAMTGDGISGHYRSVVALMAGGDEGDGGISSGEGDAASENLLDGAEQERSSMPAGGIGGDDVSSGDIESGEDGSAGGSSDGDDEGYHLVLGCSSGPVNPEPPRYVGNDTVYLEFTGTQIGRYDSMWGHGNNQDRLVYVNNVQPLGGIEDIFTMRVWQTSGRTQMSNGMFAEVQDPDGNILAGNINLKPDEEQHLAAGDEHMIMSSAGMVIDLHGLVAGDFVYGYPNEVGDPDWGDNDGELDFDQTGCAG